MINTNKDGMWEDNDCYSTNAFLCYAPKSDGIGVPPKTESPLGCMEGFYSSTHEEACYQLVDQPKSWEEAQKYCRSQGNFVRTMQIMLSSSTFHGMVMKL